jgi:hypothetical protein
MKINNQNSPIKNQYFFPSVVNPNPVDPFRILSSCQKRRKRRADNSGKKPVLLSPSPDPQRARFSDREALKTVAGLITGAKTSSPCAAKPLIC